MPMVMAGGGSSSNGDRRPGKILNRASWRAVVVVNCNNNGPALIIIDGSGGEGRSFRHGYLRYERARARDRPWPSMSIISTAGASPARPRRVTTIVPGQRKKAKCLLLEQDEQESMEKR